MASFGAGFGEKRKPDAAANDPVPKRQSRIMDLHDVDVAKMGLDPEGISEDVDRWVNIYYDGERMKALNLNVVPVMSFVAFDAAFYDPMSTDKSKTSPVPAKPGDQPSVQIEMPAEVSQKFKEIEARRDELAHSIKDELLRDESKDKATSKKKGATPAPPPPVSEERFATNRNPMVKVSAEPAKYGDTIRLTVQVDAEDLKGKKRVTTAIEKRMLLDDGNYTSARPGTWKDLLKGCAVSVVFDFGRGIWASKKGPWGTKLSARKIIIWVNKKRELDETPNLGDGKEVAWPEGAEEMLAISSPPPSSGLHDNLLAIGGPEGMEHAGGDDDGGCSQFSGDNNDA